MLARTSCALALALAALPAGGAVLYKSVTPTGTIMFSDVPPPPEARVLEERPIREASAQAPVAPSTDGLPIYQSVELDGAIERANAQVDAAEHALALARRGLWRPVEGLRLWGDPRRQAGDEDRVEFYQKELAAARKALLELVRARQHAAARWEARQRQITISSR